MSNWVAEYFRVVDSMDMDTFLDMHTDDCVLEFANNPPAVGKQQIGEAIGGLWAAIAALRHEPRNRWITDDGTGVQEATVIYTSHGGTEVPLPVSSILTQRDGKVSSLRIYIDAAPLFAQLGGEAA
jgi:ketosteroid isomerase-like protein